MNDQEVDDDAPKPHHPTVSCDGEGENQPTFGGSESSGCVSWDTVVAAEDVFVEKHCGDGSAILKSNLPRRQELTECTSAEKKPASKLSTKTASEKMSGKPAVVRKKTDPHMTKFKFSLQKYNKALKTITDGQVSLKYMHDKLVKLRDELLQTGNYKEEDLAFDSPNFREGTQLAPGQVAMIDFEPPKPESSVDLKYFLEQKNRELEALVSKNGSKATTLTNPHLSSDFLLTKNLRAKIKCTNAKALETERKLEEVKMENEDLKRQVFEFKTAIDEMEVLQMQAASKHQQAIDDLSEMRKEVEKKNEDALELIAVMSEKLSKLRAEYDAFQKENEASKKMVEELKQDYNESLAKCMEASKKWEAINDRYVSQKQMKDSIVSDFVKLGVSYKKLQSAFEDMAAENVSLKDQFGAQKGKNCQKGSSFRCFRKKSLDASRNKHVPRQRRVAVQTSEVLIHPVTSVLSGTWTDQCGDGLAQQHVDRSAYQEQMRKVEQDMKALREENANYVEKHKLLIRQVLRLDKQCHLQLSENRRQLKLIGEMKGNSKHLEEEIAVLRNKLGPAETHTSKGSAKTLPSESSSSKTKRSKVSFAVKNHPSKNSLQHSKKTWLKSLWSKENKQE
ncbi:hypothetical protein GE061_006100 [Apolygus lucorum]|uniref:Uncharacterized protein n=1 Tax=Apolygus lucorum TaxID=248454 RepID=A0A8S9WSS8_APOLU|nr:hypothetical protein GE061_006100 [Apolygus lucorum]